MGKGKRKKLKGMRREASLVTGFVSIHFSHDVISSSWKIEFC